LNKYAQTLMTLPGKRHNLTSGVVSCLIDTPKELSRIALGGKIVSVSDEFFAEASHLILVEASGPYKHSRLAYLYGSSPP